MKNEFGRNTWGRKGVGGISLSEDDLEFKKVPESLDPVEMDTGPADEVEVADFPDHGLFPVGGSEDMAQSGGIGSGSRE